MNKVFKVIWNHTLQCFVVTSEFARNFGKVKSVCSGVSNESSSNPSLFKSPRSKLAIIASSVFVSNLTSAYALDIQSYNPTDNDQLFGQYIVTSGGQVLGNDSSGKGFNAFEEGLSGREYDTVQQAFDEGRIASGTVGHDGIGMILPAKKSITYFDPITQTEVALPVYNSNDLTVTDIDSHGFYRAEAVGDGQYINMRIATVKSGGNLTVDIGSHDSDWKNQSENQFKSNFKGSNVFDVESGGTLNYDSKTVINNNPEFASASVAGAVKTLHFNEVTFQGSFTNYKGESVTVNDIASFKTYNDAVIAAIQSGELSPTSYDAELGKAYDTYVNIVNILPKTPIEPTDDILQPGSAYSNVFIHASGTDAKVNIDADASLQELNSSITVVKVEKGAILTNNGAIGVSGDIGFSDAISAASGGIVVNNGVIDVGTGRGLDTVSKIRGSRRGVVTTGTSSVTNNGVINVGGLASQTYDMDGIFATDTSTVRNSGVINVATTPNGTGVAGDMFSTGVQLLKNASLIQDGAVYIGRKAMGSLTDLVDDIAVTTPTYGVLAQNNSSVQTLSDSEMTIGSEARNSVALFMKGSGVSLDQQGTINLNGVSGGSSTLQNIAVNATDAAGSGTKQLTNSGAVNINGTNSVAFKLQGGSVFTNTGIININGGYDPVTKLANYGTWVEGAGSTMFASGTTNLNGTQAIAQHARDKGKIVITDSSKINFTTGEKQIGYYAYGTGTTVERQGTADQNVATKNSTLYRIDSGASFVDTTSDFTEMTASGASSTAILATGAGTLLNTGKIKLNITGDGATAVKVEGGATGILGTGSVIGQISGEGATVGIVDGKYYGLDGAEVAALKGDSVLTSYAELTSMNTTTGAFGYIARNGGKLDHQGTIDFTSSDSTGVLVDSGILVNSSSISVNGTGVHIKGDSTVTNSGSASVHAIDGLAAYHVDAGSSLALTGTGITSAAGTAHGVLLDTGATGLTVENATINMSATGSGSAIENKANIAGIALTNTNISVGNGIGVHTGASMADTNTGTITVNGSGTGILFENIDTSTTANELNMSDSAGLVINVTSAAGKGLVTNSSTDLNTGVSVNVNNASGGSALIVNGSTKNIKQSGVLASKSTTSSVVDIDNGAVTSFSNSGTIQAADEDQKAVETLTGMGMTFTNQSNGKIIGHVNLMAGNNTVNLDAGSSGTDFTTDAGDDTFNMNNLGVNTIGVFNSLTAGTGNDLLNIIGSDYNLSNPASLSGFETINLVKGTTRGSNLTLDNTLLPLGDAKDDTAGTAFNIDADSSLTLSHANDVAFASHLSGTGLVQVKLGTGKNFTFTDNNAMDGFDGTVALSRANMELAGVNTQALSDATLRLDGYSNVHVGNGEQTIGGLTFNGGTLRFDSGTPGETIAQGSVHTTKSMDLSGSGTVQVSKGSVSNDHPLEPTLISILAQDDANTMLQLAKSDTTTIGSGGALVLKDQDGDVISNTTTADIAQNGTTVAKGTYDYRLTSGDNSDGLYINYGLTEVELQGTGADALALNAAGQSGAAADLSAKITGAGDLAIDTGLGNTVSLSNTLNDYTGNTDIRSGNLLMVADNVLGKTDVLSLAADTALDMNGKAQTVGSLKSATGSTVDLNGGALSLSQGGLSDGSLTGSGALNVLADTLTVNGANSGLSATTTVANGATVALNDAAGLGIGDIVNAGQVIFTNAVGTVANSIRDGVEATTRALSPTAGSVDLVSSQLTLDGDNSGFSGVFNIDADSELTATAASQLGTADIADEGKLVLNAADDWALANNVSGAGSLTKQGAGVVTLSGNAAYTGLTDIQAGGLMLGSELAPVTLASTQVNVAKNAFLAGYGGVAGNVNNQGTLFVGAQNETGTAQTFTVGKDLVNSGKVNIGHGSVAGNVLNVNGNYTGNNGQLNFNTVLGDDNSITDKLIVSGNTSGTTNVQVSNAGGTGAYTLNGIELINVGGASDGEFKQAGRIVAGAYDYSLVRGQGEKTNNWYLTNTVPTPVDPGTPVDPVDPNKPTEPVDPDTSGEAVTRPEAAAYAANQAAANTLFNMTLHDRLGETHYVDAFTGQEQVTSLWLRQVGGHNRSHDSSGQNKTQANRYVAQLGGDIAQWSSDGEDRFHIGVMGGYANQSSHTRNHINGYKADGSVEGYSAGLYGTWFQDNEAKTGAYVDTWALYNWFDNEVSGQDIASESYKSKGITASVETGYTWKLGEKNERESYYIQPQAQVTWMGVTSDYHQEFNGTNVRSEGDKNIQTRLGVRAFIKGHSEMDEGKERTFEPFIEANWIHNTEEFGSRLDGVSVYQDGSRDIGELKVGVEAKLNKSTNLWGNVAQQVGGKGYSDTQAMMGVKMNF